MRVMRQVRLVHLRAGRLHLFEQGGERARIGVDRNTERLRHAQAELGAGLLRLNAGILDHLAPLAELDLDEVFQLLG